MWLPVRRALVFLLRLYNHQPAASALRICSSAPQVTNSATCSVCGPVSADIVFAKYRSTFVGRILIGVMRSPLSHEESRDRNGHRRNPVPSRPEDRGCFRNSKACRCIFQTRWSFPTELSHGAIG